MFFSLDWFMFFGISRFRLIYLYRSTYLAINKDFCIVNNQVIEQSDWSLPQINWENLRPLAW
jgi:hypothetical protein